MFFPGGKLKAVTFSYDDGVEFDKPLIELLNRYGLKGTFNINTGRQRHTDSWSDGGVLIHHLDLEKMPAIYQGHEVAVHTSTHPDLTKLEPAQIQAEITQDREMITNLFGTPCNGMAYPYGTHNQQVMDIARACGIQYARTTISTEDFEVSSDLLALRATCHHNNPRLMELADQFLALQPDRPQIFYIWGHAHEFEIHQNWGMFEAFCQKISQKDDIFYGTNDDVLKPFYTA